MVVEWGEMTFRTSSRPGRGGSSHSRGNQGAQPDLSIAFLWQPGKPRACAVAPSGHVYLMSATAPEEGEAQVVGPHLTEENTEAQRGEALAQVPHLLSSTEVENWASRLLPHPRTDEQGRPQLTSGPPRAMSLLAHSDPREFPPPRPMQQPPAAGSFVQEHGTDSFLLGLSLSGQGTLATRTRELGVSGGFGTILPWPAADG